jgi:hypothetical protein
VFCVICMAVICVVCTAVFCVVCTVFIQRRFGWCKIAYAFTPFPSSPLHFVTICGWISKHCPRSSFSPSVELRSSWQSRCCTPVSVNRRRSLIRNYWRWKVGVWVWVWVWVRVGVKESAVGVCNCMVIWGREVGGTGIQCCEFSDFLLILEIVDRFRRMLIERSYSPGLRGTEKHWKNFTIPFCLCYTQLISFCF